MPSERADRPWSGPLKAFQLIRGQRDFVDGIDAAQVEKIDHRCDQSAILVLIRIGHEVLAVQHPQSSFLANLPFHRLLDRLPSIDESAWQPPLSLAGITSSADHQQFMLVVGDQGPHGRNRTKVLGEPARLASKRNGSRLRVLRRSADKTCRQIQSKATSWRVPISGASPVLISGRAVQRCGGEGPA